MNGSESSGIARQFVRSVIRFYYPTIQISGKEFVPLTGPTLFVANHANSLIDPVIIGITTGRPVHFLAKAPLFDIPVFGQMLLSLGMLPAYRGSDDRSQVEGNLKSLGEAAAIIARGQAVGIFPEGKSHDALMVDKVRSGAARIAVQAVQQGAKDLKIVPIGINYERKEKFRSSIWVRVGKPIEAAEWREKIETEERVAMRGLTTEIDARLKEIVIHLNEPNLEPVVYDLEALIPPVGENRKGPVAALRQRKRIADAMNHFLATDRPRAEAIANDIQMHRQTLESAGLNIQSDLFRLRYTRLFLRQTWDFIWLLFGFIPAVCGSIYNLIPFSLLRLVTHLLPKTNRSTISLIKLGLGIPIFGVWYVFGWTRLADYFLPWFATVWSILMIFAGVFSMGYWRRGRKAAQLWWAEMRMLLQQEKLTQLRANHLQLRGRLDEIAQEYRRVHPIAEMPMPGPSIGRIVQRAAAWVISVAGIIAISTVAFSRLNVRPLAELAYGGPDLTRISPASFSEQLAADENAVHDMILGLRDVEQRTLKLRAEFESGQRDFYRQADNDLMRQLMLSYANYRTALLRLLWKYQRYADLPEEKPQLRAFLTGFVSACVLYETSLKFVTYFQASPEAVRKLNESEPLWNIPGGLFDTIERDLANSANKRLFTDACATYEEFKPQFQKNGLSSIQPFSFFHETIPASIQEIRRLQPKIRKTDLTRTIDEAHDNSKEAIYRTKTIVSSWIGDTKIREPRAGETLIQDAEVELLREKLKPGDIILERRNWFLSNAFLPGYWPHAALYVGTVDDLRRMKLDQDSRVARQWKKFLSKDAEGHQHVIIESVSEGVVFSSLEHSIGGADSAAVLRPRLPDEKVREAIARAFGHVGKPYDFEFDFFSTDKLVCTELVFRSYDGDITFPLVTILGTKTMPALELVRKFNDERGKPEAQLEFVAFLDGEESKGKARFRDEEVFVGTLKRPALTWLQK